MTAQKLIFPGIIFGILSMLGFISLLTATPGRAEVDRSTIPLSAANNAAAPAAAKQAARSSGGDQCSISPDYPESIRQWCSIIEQAARDHGVDPNLISAVMMQESAGNPEAYSKSGAVGLLQVMPRDGKASGFMCINGPCFADRPSTEELFDPEFNISYGVRMLAGLIERNGGVRDALRAYGPKDVGYYYADIVLGIFNSHQ